MLKNEGLLSEEMSQKSFNHNYHEERLVGKFACKLPQAICDAICDM
ncbi:19341_t:CDS:2 [Racocetra persica]|uniref:19341_t:CDS:1 n=1 Tax=Racocetra persica TaxID=160502 RepID=A0ACA9MR18_9GLOM|nr:19341_t:CDS:2 [Racocetra persica]